jgi:O-antigen/teichoic acid export membrane protein
MGIPVFIPSLIVTPLFPALSRSVHAPDALRRAIAHTLKMSLLLTVPISAGIYVIAPALPGLFGWPADYSNVVPLLKILSLQMPIVTVDMVLGTVIMAIGRERQWVKVGVVAIVLNVLGNLLAIPFFESIAGNGAIGSSILTVVTEVWMFVGALMLIPGQLLDRKTIFVGSRIVAAAVASAVVATSLLDASLVVSGAAGGATYLLTAAGLRVVTGSDLRYVTDRVLRRAPARTLTA